MDPSEAVRWAVARDEEGWSLPRAEERWALGRDEEQSPVARSGDGSAGTAAMVAAVVLLGPVDVAVTLSAWHLESNPVVLALGPSGWVAAKAAALGAAVWVWHVLRRREGMPALADAWMLLLAIAAAMVVGVNLAVVAGA